MLNVVHPNTLRNTLVTRVRDLIDPYVVDSSELLRNLDDAIVFIKIIRKFDATCVVKTWANAWATSHRMHEEIVLPCLFGCSQTDSLQHYLFLPNPIRSP